LYSWRDCNRKGREIYGEVGTEKESKEKKKISDRDKLSKKRAREREIDKRRNRYIDI
jgi:hypothetical protein